MLDFEFGNVAVTEFGVGRDDDNGPDFVAISVDTDVQTALLEMARVTWEQMQNQGDPTRYQPSEKHSSTEYLFVPEDDDLDNVIRTLHGANNLPIDGNALSEPDSIFCYFARFIDGKNRRLTALRRASYFKGVLRKRLIHLVNDLLAMVEDKVFKLDSDFDLLMDSDRTHIWRPSAFEFLSSVKQAILDAVPDNIASIKPDLGFLDFGGIQDYASTHSRAARCLASIRTQRLAGITRDSLVNLCRTMGVEIEETNGLLTVADAHVIGFLDVLDRRMYRVELVPDVPEQFRASSRHRINM